MVKMTNLKFDLQSVEMMLMMLVMGIEYCSRLKGSPGFVATLGDTNVLLESRDSLLSSCSQAFFVSSDRFDIWGFFL